MKVLIIGVDGATWDVLDQSVLENCMPTLQKLKQTGSSGILESTIPPLTPAAWTTCITGCRPHIHGVVDFKKYSFQDNSVKLVDTTDVQVPTLWHYLDQQGYSFACLNVPFTYPPFPLEKGIMVSGFGCPGTTAEFTSPPDFKSEIFSHIPDYSVGLGQERYPKRKYGLGNDEITFRTTMGILIRRLNQRLELAQFVQTDHPVEVMMVQFQPLDLLQHLCWPYMDPRTRNRYRWQRDQIFEFYRQLDHVIQQLVSMVNLAEGLVIVASDHGFGPLNFSIFVNQYLQRWGYVKRANPWSRLVRRTRRNIIKRTRSSGQKMSLQRKYPVNWSKTKAIAVRCPGYGAIYLNVKDRQPHGSIQPGKEYIDTIQDLKHRFQGLVNPHSGEKVFDRLATPGELWGNQEKYCEAYGDLLLLPKEGYDYHTSLKKRSHFIATLRDGPFRASIHYPQGMYVINGKDIKREYQTPAHIADLVPTLYSWLKISIPAECDGVPLLDVFEENPHCVQQKTQRFPSSYTSKDQNTPKIHEGKEALIGQLQNLGYLE